jgi:hypothetical protein
MVTKFCAVGTGILVSGSHCTNHGTTAVTKATPKFAITTADVSTPENADKVINLTTNRGGADFLIAGGADENKFHLR